MTIRTLHLGPVQCMRCMPPLNNVTRNPNHGNNLLLLLIYMASFATIVSLSHSLENKAAILIVIFP